MGRCPRASVDTEFLELGGFDPDATARRHGEDPPPDEVRDDSWMTPLPLASARDVPPFPVDSLPEWLRKYVECEAHATQTPVDMPAVFALTALAAIAGGRATVEARPGWGEGLQLFTAIAMEPGSRKSQVKRDTEAPLLDFEQRLIEREQPQVAQAESKRRIAEAALKKAEQVAANARDEERFAVEITATSLASELASSSVPVLPRLVAGDATPEAVVRLLHDHGGRIAILSAEGGPFDQMAGRYSNGVPNLDVYLSGHSGDPIRVDRRGRAAEYIKDPALTIGLAVQPFVLRKVATNKDMAGRGLLDRFLYAMPAGNVGFRQINPEPVPAAVASQYSNHMTILARSLYELPEPYRLSLTPDAQQALTDWRADLEPRRRPDAELGHIQGWASKLDGATVRIAGLLHLAKYVDGSWGNPIDVDTMKAAIEVARYFVAHALAVFDYMCAHGTSEDARRVLRWIIGRPRPAAPFSQRECHRAIAHLSGFERSTDLEPALDVLEERGYIRRQVSRDHEFRRSRVPHHPERR